MKIYEVKNVGGGSLRSFYRLQISEQEFEVKTFTQLMHSARSFFSTENKFVTHSWPVLNLAVG